MRLSGESIPREEWWTWRDHVVHIDRLTNSNAKVVVMLLHGGGGNGRVLMTLAPMLRDLGAEVIAPDLPGYGLTIRRRGFVPSYSLWADLAADLAAEESARRGLPLIAFGLSLGGLLAYATAARSEAVKGIVATTMADTRERSTYLEIARSRVLAAVSMPFLTIAPPAVKRLCIPIRWVAPMERITNDPDFSAVFARDPLAGGSRVALGFLHSMQKIHIPIEPEAFTDTPVLVAHPELDPWTPPDLSRRFFDRIAAEKEWVDLEGCGHLPYEEPGRLQMKDALAGFLSKIAAQGAVG